MIIKSSQRAIVLALVLVGGWAFTSPAGAQEFNSHYEASSGQFPDQVCPAWTLGDRMEVDTNDAPHTYRVEVNSLGGIRVFYDDVLPLNGSMFTNAAPAQINWGDIIETVSLHPERRASMQKRQ
ncbi:MAG: hypothetical protein ACRERD_30735 [Candidatus Binatia bacterium]